MAKDAAGAVEEEREAGGVEQAEQHEQRDVHEPEGDREAMQSG